ncbi:hypothetical protein EON81_22570 [bacterium]|nr:MAG: hypothetical protein EON81_22570 [bacterium]
MPIAMLMLLAPMGPADIVLDRYAKWTESHSSFMVKGTASAPGMKDPVLFELRMHKPDSLWFHAKLGAADYRVSKTPEGQVETEASQKVFDESEAVPGLRMNASEISGLPAFAYPAWLSAPDLKGAFVGDSKVEKTRIGATAVELVSSHLERGGEVIEAWGWFDAKGAPLRFRFRAQSPMSSSDTTWNLSAFATLPKGTPFALTIPGDHTPFRLSSSDYPLSIGASIKLGTWEKGGKPIDLDEEAKGTALLAVLTPDVEPSKRIQAALDKLEKGGLKVLRLSDGKSDPTWIYDPTGQRLTGLRVPATPYMMLLKEGKISGLWLGAEADDEEVVKEVQSVVKSKAGVF